MTTTTLRPLLRSLDPLPDETLSGYVLRLSHRLCIAPAHLVKRTGLGTSTVDGTKVFRIAMNSVFTLERAREELFTRTTRLSPDEVRGLLLSPLGHRYGPLNPHYLKSPAPSRVTHNNTWVLTDEIRYCPECLAGNGSEIEALHGGAWRRLWRLPVAFACVRHQQLLRDRCPDCCELVHAGGANSMIARLNDDELHPTQCRSTPDTSAKERSVRPACGADLTAAKGDELRSLSPQTRRIIYSTQARFESLLADDGPEQVGSVGWTVPVAQYFMDLRALTALIFMTWPEARPHAATPTLAQALDAEAQRRHEDFLQRRAAPGKSGHAARAYNGPPTDPLAAAAVFEMADRFLRTPDEHAASALLEPLAAEARYAHQPISYTIRRAQGTSVPLQVVLLTHRRGARTENITDIIERNEGLTRWPTNLPQTAK